MNKSNKGILITVNEAKLAIAYISYVLYCESFDLLSFSHEDKEGLQKLLKKLNKGVKLPHEGGKYEVN